VAISQSAPLSNDWSRNCNMSCGLCPFRILSSLANSCMPSVISSRSVYAAKNLQKGISIISINKPGIGGTYVGTSVVRSFLCRHVLRRNLV
jgi:hypothetical protein